MKLYVIAGEASGDLHGSNLLKALYANNADLQCRVWGGDLMAATGATLVKHYRDLAFMGFIEVLRNLRTILRNIAFCKQDILHDKPDALVLIDYPGFNLRIAKWAREQHIPVIYYISPQIWAWHQSRVKNIRRDVDLLLVILPFEQQFFKDHNVDAVYVGHPLLDAIRNFEQQPHSASFPGNTIALLPGSRKQEIRRILPVMLAASRHFPAYSFAIAAATAIPDSFYAPYVEQYPGVSLLRDQTYLLLNHSVAALVKSGTSTLETALFKVPQVVCYAGNNLSYQIARRLVTVKYISLVNLIVDKPLVEELIQHDLNESNVTNALKRILDPVHSGALKQEYEKMRQKLGEGGASAKAAREILRFVETRM